MHKQLAAGVRQDSRLKALHRMHSRRKWLFQEANRPGASHFIVLPFHFLIYMLPGPKTQLHAPTPQPQKGNQMFPSSLPPRASRELAQLKRPTERISRVAPGASFQLVIGVT
mmetsp:Transcript_43762/g.126447  ORF Transcript_43762/g.126447 Transcript_43762/m.126447 type:complete len:112 (+) Transcript_43762:686-1021(+)